MTKRTIGFLCLILAAVFFFLYVADADPARLAAQCAGLFEGTLTGSLLFGGPSAGPGIVDVALLALRVFLPLRLLRAVADRRAAAAAAVARARAEALAKARGPDPWQRVEGGAASEPDIRLPDFDQEGFLNGAKTLFVRLQGDWDRRDIEDIATFAAPAILNEIKAQAAEDPTPSVTEIILLDASLVAAGPDGDNDCVTVYFDALVREAPDAETLVQARELWHFTRPANAATPWRLEGIQQVE